MHGETAKVECAHGFEVTAENMGVGEQLLVCRDGRWTPKTFVCAQQTRWVGDF